MNLPPEIVRLTEEYTAKSRAFDQRKAPAAEARFAAGKLAQAMMAYVAELRANPPITSAEQLRERYGVNVPKCSRCGGSGDEPSGYGKTD